MGLPLRVAWVKRLSTVSRIRTEDRQSNHQTMNDERVTGGFVCWLQNEGSPLSQSPGPKSDYYCVLVQHQQHNLPPAIWTRCSHLHGGRLPTYPLRLGRGLGVSKGNGEKKTWCQQSS